MANIDLSQVRWDDEPETTQRPAAIDLSSIQWDDEPAATIATAEPARAPGGLAERAMLGVTEPFVGAAQLLANAYQNPSVREATGKATSYISPAGGMAAQFIDQLVGQAGFDAFKERQDTLATDLAQRQREIAPEGIDFARMAGNVAGFIPMTVGGGSGGTVGQMMLRGAAIGGSAAAAQPVENAGDTGEYFAQKAGSVAVGTTAGAIVGPAAEKLAGAIGKALSGVKAAVTPKMTTPEIKVKLVQIFERNGVDLSKLPAKYVDDVAGDVATAMKAGGSLDEKTLANLATAKALGIDLTKGQATQSPTQYGRELFLRQGPGGDRLATQYTGALSKLNQNLDDVAAGRNMQQPLLNVEAGRKALEALRNADKPAKKSVDRLYDSARARIGMDEPLDQASLVSKTFDRLQEAGVVDKLPSQFSRALNSMSNGEVKLTMREAQMMIRAANQRMGATADPTEKVALRVFKNALDETIDDAGTAMGKDAAAAFRLARQAASKRFSTIEKIPALKEALEDGMAPDDFMRKAVYGAKLDDLKAMRAYMRSNNREAWNQIRSQVLADMKQAATGGSDEAASFSQAAFNRQLNSLKQSGKLGVMFAPSEIKVLESVGRVGRMIQQGPPGVLRTGALGSAQALDRLMTILGKLPLLGRAGGLAQAMGQKGSNVLQASAALKPPPLAALESSISTQAAGRIAALAATVPPVAISND